MLLHGNGSPGSSGSSYASTWLGGGKGGKRRAVTVGAITTAAVVGVGVVAAAVTLKVTSHTSTINSSSQVAAITPSFKAVANVTPPVVSSTCAAPTSFTYSGILTATTRGTVKYQWVYSSGNPGPVQTVSFTGAGRKAVTGETVKTGTAGSGWAEIKMISPVTLTSQKATYKLLCNKPGATSQIGASASVLVPSGTVTCGTTPPSLTATGSITDAKAGTVTYYWAQSNGQDSAPATLNFTAPGTMAAEPLTITPSAAPSSGGAVLVVTSPVAAASNSATYTLSCTTPVKLALSATATVSPATQTLTSCTAAAPTFTFNGTISDNTARHGQLLLEASQRERGDPDAELRQAGQPVGRRDVQAKQRQCHRVGLDRGHEPGQREVERRRVLGGLRPSAGSLQQRPDDRHGRPGLLGHGHRDRRQGHPHLGRRDRAPRRADLKR